MPLFVRSIGFLALPLASIAHARSLPEVNDASWEQNLESVSRSSLKAAIESNLQPKYQEGVFEDEHEAIAAVHSEDANLASQLVDLAKQDAAIKDYLRKRQDNATVSTDSATTSSVIVTDLETTTEVETETVQATTTAPTSQGQSSSLSSVESSEAEPSTVVVVDTSAVTRTLSSTVSSVQATSSNNEGQTTPASTLPSVQTETLPTSSSPPEQGSSLIVVPDTSAPATTQTGVLVPITTTATADQSTVVVTTTAFETTAQTTIAVEQTTTNDEGQTVVTTTEQPATIVTQTDAEGSTIVTTSPVPEVTVAPGGSIVTSAPDSVTTTDSQGDSVVLTRPTSGGVYTATDSGGDVAIVTYQPGGGTVSQVRVRTTTLPNGQRSTITSFAEVGAETGTPEANGGGSSEEQPGLQSGAVSVSGYFGAGLTLFAGALIGAAMLW
ncbi:hypothetical protein CB0940_00482 [Cercospora beticola]|uniref:Uncharacterized protein n=1 Tax=Cercospora beticola TaxID=122368 RepID=A0A2G5ICF1_CERBT|nr:hypothetical protein CB0940_00482 [Cercospora beticola]PIB02441.1 hypothetical protein CB0940_00482 [Cercospora beticola]